MTASATRNRLDSTGEPGHREVLRDPADEPPRHLVLAEAGPALDAFGRHQRHFASSPPPMTPPSGRRHWRRSGRRPSCLSLVVALSTRSSVSGGEADDEAGPPGPAMGDGGEDVGIFRKRERRHLAAAVLLDLLAATSVAGRQSATAAAKTAISAGSAASTAASIVRAVSTPTAVTPGGSARARPVHDQRHARAGIARRSGDREALLAGRAVGDIADGIDRLMRGAGGDEHAARRERTGTAGDSSASAAAAMGERLAPSALARLAALGHLATRADRRHGCRRRQSWSRLRSVAGFAHISRFMAGASSTGAAVAKQDRRWRDRRRMAMRELRHQIGSRPGRR